MVYTAGQSTVCHSYTSNIAYTPPTDKVAAYLQFALHCCMLLPCIGFGEVCASAARVMLKIHQNVLHKIWHRASVHTNRVMPPKTARCPQWAAAVAASAAALLQPEDPLPGAPLWHVHCTSPATKCDIQQWM
jgi:hypothetical protein